jgi:hypothetical protein
MKHDPFDFKPELTNRERAWRIVLLLAFIAVLMLDMFYWRPS